MGRSVVQWTSLALTSLRSPAAAPLFHTLISLSALYSVHFCSNLSLTAFAHLSPLFLFSSLLMADFQSSLAAAFAAELGLLDAEEAKETAARNARAQEIAAAIAEEQQQRSEHYFSVDSLDSVSLARQNSAALLAEAESAEFRSKFGRKEADSQSTEQSDKYTPVSKDELEGKIASILDDSEENYRKMTARRLAEGEKRRREKEENELRQAERRERESRGKEADRLMEAERVERMNREKLDENLQDKEIAAKLSLLVKLEGFSSPVKEMKERLDASLSPHRKDQWAQKRSEILDRLAEEERKFEEMKERRRKWQQVDQLMEQERIERIKDEQTHSNEVNEMKKNRRRESLLMLMEMKSGEFQAKWKQHGKNGTESNLSEEEKKRWESERQQRLEEIKRICEEREREEEFKEEERRLEEERKRTVALIEELVKKEQEERIREHEAGADEMKINETRRIAVQVLLESQSEEHQVKHMAHVLIGDAMIDPDEEEEYKEQAEHRHFQAAAIVAEREEQERRKREMKQEIVAEQRERRENIKKATELEEEEKRQRIEEAARGADQVRKSVSHAVAEQLHEQISRRGSAAASLRPSAANSRATSRRGSVVAAPPQISMAAMLTAVKEHLHPVGDSSRTGSKAPSRRGSASESK